MTNKNDYTKRPVTIQAVEWTGKNLREVITFTDGPPDARTMHAQMKWEDYCDLVERDGLKIHTLEGVMSAAIGDYIIKGVKGEHYPCKPDVFHLTYSKPTVKPVHSAALTARAPSQGEQVRDVSAMARVLSDRVASACCVDPVDNWKIYGHEFIEDVRAMLAATAPGKGGEQKPYAIECGLSNGDETYSVHIKRYPLPSYLVPYEGSPVKLLYTHPATPADSRVVPEGWANMDASFVVEHIRRTSVFDADMIEAMLNYAISSAAPAPAPTSRLADYVVAPSFGSGTAPVEPAHSDVSVPEPFVRFLLGEVEIDGYGFGDSQPDMKGNFWWRSQLRALLNGGRS